MIGRVFHKNLLLFLLWVRHFISPLSLSISPLQATKEQQGLEEALEGVAEDVKLAEMLQVCMNVRSPPPPVRPSSTKPGLERP